MSNNCPKCGSPLGPTAGLYRGKQRYFCTGPIRHKIVPGISKPTAEKPVAVRVDIEQSLVQQIDDRAGKGKRSEFIRGAISDSIKTGWYSMQSAPVVNDRVWKHFKISGKQVGTVTEADATRYYENHSDDDPWVTVTWDNGFGSQTSTWSNLSADGVRIAE